MHYDGPTEGSSARGTGKMVGMGEKARERVKRAGTWGMARGSGNSAGAVGRSRRTWVPRPSGDPDCEV